MQVRIRLLLKYLKESACALTAEGIVVPVGVSSLLSFCAASLKTWISFSDFTGVLGLVHTNVNEILIVLLSPVCPVIGCNPLV